MHLYQQKVNSDLSKELGFEPQGRRFCYYYYVSSLVVKENDASKDSGPLGVVVIRLV